jgi:hypothetical protein
MANRIDTPRAGIARRDAAFAQSDRSLATTPAPAAHGTVALERQVSCCAGGLSASMRAPASAITLTTGTAQGASTQR